MPKKSRRKPRVLLNWIVLILVIALLIYFLNSLMGTDSERFADGSEVIIDYQLDLAWQKCSAGQLPPDCRGAAVQYQWPRAKDYCDNLILSGYSSWRLPSQVELESLVGNGRHDPSIISDFFINNPADHFWTVNQDYQGRAETVSFGAGYVEPSELDQYWHVRCVHDL